MPAVLTIERGSSPAMRCVIGSLIAHMVVAQLVPAPWWVPDLTLVGMIYAVAHSPRRWFLYSSIAGLSTMVWAARDPAPLFITSLVMGWMVQALTTRWDASDARVQLTMVGMASLSTTLGAIWLEACWSWSMLGLGVAHIAVTCLSALGMQRLIDGCARAGVVRSR